VRPQPWRREELVAVLKLYCVTPFGKMAAPNLLKLSLYREIFPRMSSFLPDGEGEQYCFQFEEELKRLEAA